MDTEQLKVVRSKVLAQTLNARKLIAAMYDSADWMTRDELAKALQKNRLNPHDIVLLDRLAVASLIDTRKRDRPRRIGFEFIYRLQPSVHRGINELRQIKRTGQRTDPAQRKGM